MSWMKWLPWRFVIRRIARSAGLPGSDRPAGAAAQLCPAVRSGRAHRVAACRRGVPRPRPDQQPRDPAQSRLGLALLDRTPVRSRATTRSFRAPSPSPTSISPIATGPRSAIPDCEELPIVDPRGLLTPLLDGWSLDGWLLAEDGRCLLPSRAADCRQRQDMDRGVRITTETEMPGLALDEQRLGRARIGHPGLQAAVAGAQPTRTPGWCWRCARTTRRASASSIRSTCRATARPGRSTTRSASNSAPPPRGTMSPTTATGTCTFISRIWTIRPRAAATWAWSPRRPCSRSRPARPPRSSRPYRSPPAASATLVADAWNTAHRSRCKLVCPEPRYQFLYDAAITSLILHSPDDVYPGPTPTSASGSAMPRSSSTPCCAPG